MAHRDSGFPGSKIKSKETPCFQASRIGTCYLGSTPFASSASQPSSIMTITEISIFFPLDKTWLNLARKFFFLGPNNPFFSVGTLNCFDKFFTSIIVESF